jgi:hypothetical protein
MGGILDLTTEEWFGAFPEKLSVHVIDSSRPQNLGNLFAAGEMSDRIIVWDDGDVEKLKEEKTAWEALTVSAQFQYPTSNSTAAPPVSMSRSPIQTKIPRRSLMMRWRTKMRMVGMRMQMRMRMDHPCLGTSEGH